MGFLEKPESVMNHTHRALIWPVAARKEEKYE
jgi:hypothetical protein